MAVTTETYGSVDSLEDGRWRLRFTRTLRHPVERVWRAITEPEHLAAWFPCTVDGERRPGAELCFEFPNGEAPPFTGEVVAFDPPRAFEFSWGPDLVHIELAPSGDGTTSRCSTPSASAERLRATEPAGTAASMR